MTDKQAIFDVYSMYYDLLYKDKDYHAEVDYIDGLLKRHKVNSKKLLEFGSGTGKHGRLLAERGYVITGIEQSAQMAALATPVPGFHCIEGDIRSIRLGRKFGAVLSLFHVMSYQISNQCVNSVFARAAEHLESDGLFIFDVWYSPAVYSQRPVVRIKRMFDDQVEITRIAEPDIFPNENKVNVNYTIFANRQGTVGTQVLTEVHSMRHFSMLELELFSTLHGFEIVTAEEFVTARAPGEGTWGVCLILRKIAS